MGKKTSTAQASVDFIKTAKFLVFMAFLDTIAVATVIIHIFPRVLELGASHAQTGLVASIYGAVQLFVSPIMGNIADGGNKRNLLIISALASAGSYALLANPSLLTFCISRVICGMVKHTQLMLMGIMSDVAPKEEKSKYLGFFGAGIGLGFIFGPIIGGHLAELENGFFWMCAFTSTVFVANAGLIATFLPTTVTVKSKSDTPKDPKAKSEGFLQDLGIDTCWDILLLQGLCELACMVHFTGIGLIFTQDYQLNPSYIGYTIAGTSIIGTATAILAGKLENFAGERTVTYVFLSILLSYAVLDVPGIRFATYIVAILCSSVGLGLLRSWWPGLAMARVTPDKASATVGAMHSVMAVAGMLGPVINGVTTQSTGTPHGGTYVATLLFALACALSRWFQPPTAAKLKNT